MVAIWSSGWFFCKKQKPQNRCGSRAFLELLARFELATSSLPRRGGLPPPRSPRYCVDTLRVFGFLYERTGFKEQKHTASFFIMVSYHITCSRYKTFTLFYTHLRATHYTNEHQSNIYEHFSTRPHTLPTTIHRLLKKLFEKVQKLSWGIRSIGYPFWYNTGVKSEGHEDTNRSKN